MGLDVRGRNEDDEARPEGVRVSSEQGRLVLKTAEFIFAKENKAIFPLLSEPTLILCHEVKGNSGWDT